MQWLNNKEVDVQVKSVSLNHLTVASMPFLMKLQRTLHNVFLAAANFKCFIFCLISQLKMYNYN